MDRDAAIVRPFPRKRTPPLGPLALLVATPPDVAELCRRLGLEGAAAETFYLSRLFPRPPEFALAGPFIGAPYAVMLLESLVSWGVRRFLLLGWCGAVDPAVRAGDLILPTCGLVDEGTSRHYRPGTKAAAADAGWGAALRRELAACGAPYHEGPVCSTDGIFRETPRQIEAFRARGALAVDMELSALLSAGAALGVAVGGLLVVSDELSTLEWRPGFRDPRFQQARHTACGIVERLCRSL